jgi:hypothetical protein
LRKNPTTIKLAEIRRLIRVAIGYYRVDEGLSDSWTSENYKKARHIPHPAHIGDSYYVRSDRAIEDIAKKILEVAVED